MNIPGLRDANDAVQLPQNAPSERESFQKVAVAGSVDREPLKFVFWRYPFYDVLGRRTQTIFFGSAFPFAERATLLNVVTTNNNMWYSDWLRSCWKSFLLKTHDKYEINSEKVMIYCSKLPSACQNIPPKSWLMTSYQPLDIRIYSFGHSWAFRAPSNTSLFRLLCWESFTVWRLKVRRTFTSVITPYYHASLLVSLISK